MKKLLVVLLVLAVGVAGTLAVQKYLLKSPGPGVQKIAAAEENSFDRVTRNLDPGGTFYMYLGTEKIIETAEKLLATTKKIALAEAKEPPAKKKWMEHSFDVVAMLLKDSGLFEISGIGVSSIPMKNGFNHSRVVVHHYKDKGEGLMWNLWEDGPHALDSQQLLPANTVLASFSDCGLNYFWEWLNKEAAKTGIPEIQKGLEQVKPMLKSKGLDLDGILGSLGGKWGFIVTFDEEKKGKFPIKGQAIEFPDPAFALVLYVKDETIFNLLQKLSMAPPKVEGNVKKLVGPQNPGAPITLAPLVAQKGNLLILASNGKLVDEIFAGQAGKGLLVSEEFKNLSVNMPEKGNGYTFLSSKIIQTILDVQKKIGDMSGKETQEKFAVFEQLNLIPKDLAVYNVMQNTDEGFIFTSNNNMPVGTAALLPALAVGGIVAAIAIPNLIAAKKKSELKVTMGDMKTIGTAIEAYMIDNGYAPQVESMAELKTLLEPFYIKTLPLVDGWGFDFHYTHGSGEQQDAYSLGSGGKDGLFEGFDQAGFYVAAGPDDFAKDIIFSNGMFIYGPRKK